MACRFPDTQPRSVMKKLLLITALPLLGFLATAQDNPPALPKAEKVPVKEEAKSKRPAWLGVSLGVADGAVKLEWVQPGSPAAKAGLKKDDTVLAIGDRRIQGDAEQVVQTVQGKQPGEAVEVRIRRGSEEKTIRVELGEFPESSLEFRGEFQRKPEEKAPAPPEKERKKRIDDIQGVKEKMAQAKEKLRLEMKHLQEPDENLQKHLEKLRELQKMPSLPPKKLPSGAGPGLAPLLMMPDKAREQAIWKRVEETVGRALKESGLSPEVVGKAMEAVKEARRQGSEQEMRKAKLKAEAAKLEKEIEALRQRADRVREELQRAGE